MREVVKDLVEAIKLELQAMNFLEEEAQIRKMLEEDGEIKTYRGEIKFDIPALDMAYSVHSDQIIRRLNDMEMREQITEDELEYVLEQTDLL